MPLPTKELLTECRSLMAAGKRVAAIKKYRSITGATLPEAQRALDNKRPLKPEDVPALKWDLVSNLVKEIIVSENLTKDGIEVRAGQVWRDLDKRMNGRTRKVVAVEFGKAVMQSPHQPSGAKTKVSIKRMHKNSTGWELVTDVP